MHSQVKSMLVTVKESHGVKVNIWSIFVKQRVQQQNSGWIMLRFWCLWLQNNCCEIRLVFQAHHRAKLAVVAWLVIACYVDVTIWRCSFGCFGKEACYFFKVHLLSLRRHLLVATRLWSLYSVLPLSANTPVCKLPWAAWLQLIFFIGVG